MSVIGRLDDQVDAVLIKPLKRSQHGDTPDAAHAPSEPVTQSPPPAPPDEAPPPDELPVWLL